MSAPPAAPMGYQQASYQQGAPAMPLAVADASAPPPSIGAAGPSAPPPLDAAAAARARFERFVAMREVKPAMADDLYGVLTTSRVVLLLDDSGSMNSSVSDPLQPSFTPTTRWAELLRLADCCIDIITSCTPAGCDCYFLNRPPILGVTGHDAIAPAFAYPPQGGTPLIGQLQRIFQTYLAEAEAGRRVIVVVITDGEPSDGSPDNLFQLLSAGRHPNIHISLAECNDNEEEMSYLDGWDQRLPNFDNSDDFSFELRRVRAQNGPQYRFTYMDYAVKIILGSSMRKYFMQDGGGGAPPQPRQFAGQGPMAQQQMTALELRQLQQRNQAQYSQGGCCAVA